MRGWEKNSYRDGDGPDKPVQVLMSYRGIRPLPSIQPAQGNGPNKVSALTVPRSWCIVAILEVLYEEGMDDDYWYNTCVCFSTTAERDPIDSIKELTITYSSTPLKGRAIKLKIRKSVDLATLSHSTHTALIAAKQREGGARSLHYPIILRMRKQSWVAYSHA